MILANAILAAEPDFTALDVFHEYVGYLGSFFTVGAAAFYFLLLRSSLRDRDGAMRGAARIAARVGMVGALFRLVAIAISTSDNMTAHQQSLVQALIAKPANLLVEVATLVALVAFAIAANRRSASGEMLGPWMVAALATLVFALRGLITTDLGDMVNPVHVFAASMWIGTLFVLVCAGITTALGPAVLAAERGPAVAGLVNRFSTLALASAGVLVLTGVTTAYLHLRHLSNLWTTIYGQTLIVKLVVVACVFAAGTYNNRRMKPTLGTEAAAGKLRRSAAIEIGLAAVVLMFSAVLVNLPTPEPDVRAQRVRLLPSEVNGHSPDSSR